LKSRSMPKHFGRLVSNESDSQEKIETNILRCNKACNIMGVMM
jgi:hypothetical protein